MNIGVIVGGCGGGWSGGWVRVVVMTVDLYFYVCTTVDW